MADPASGRSSTPRPLGPGLARWLLLAALALLLTEVVLAWQFGHYSGVPTNEPPPAPNRWLPALAAILAGLTLLILIGVLLPAFSTGDFLSFLPEGLRRAVESTLGIAPPAAGEGSRWRLEFMPYLWDTESDPWLAGLLAVIGAGAIYWIYRQESRSLHVSLRYRVLLVGLRVCLLLLALIVLLPQLQLWFERQGWPDVVLLIDDSQSMSTVDRFQDARVKALSEELAQEGALDQPERLRLAQALLTRPDQDWLTALLKQHKVRIHVYHCSTRAARLADVAEAGQVQGALQAIQDLRAVSGNDSSQLGMAVRQVLNDFRGSSLAAVIMLTDGVTTEGEDLGRVSRVCRPGGRAAVFRGPGRYP